MHAGLYKSNSEWLKVVMIENGEVTIYRVLPILRNSNNFENFEFWGRC